MSSSGDDPYDDVPREKTPLSTQILVWLSVLGVVAAMMIVLALVLVWGFATQLPPD